MYKFAFLDNYMHACANKSADSYKWFGLSLWNCGQEMGQQASK